MLINNSGLLDFNGNNNTLGTLVLVGGQIALPGASTLTLSTDLTTNTSSFPALITGTGTLDLGGVARNFNVAPGLDPSNPDLTIGVPITNDGGKRHHQDRRRNARAHVSSAGVSNFYTGPTTIVAGTLQTARPREPCSSTARCRTRRSPWATAPPWAAPARSERSP